MGIKIKIICIWLLFIIVISCTQKGTNVDPFQVKNDTIKEIEKSFQLDNEENTAIKYRRLDSLHSSYINRITCHKRYLKYYSHPKQGRNIESLNIEDSLIFQFTKDGKIIERHLGYIGKWRLHLSIGPDTLYTKILLLDVKNKYFKDSIFTSKSYFFMFNNNDTLLSVNGHSIDKGTSYYKFIMVR